MKATGLSWCPMIPDNWEVLPAKEIFFKNKRDITDTDEVVTCFRDGEVTLRKNRRSTGYTESEEYAGFQGVRVNDLVIHQMDAFAGAIGVSDSNGMCTSVYHCCTPIGNHDVHYFKYLLRYMAFSGYIASLSKGIRERSTDFSYNIFRRQLLIIPPYNEQKKIAAYLDEKIADINATIAARNEELKLLKKFKQSKIAEVVTHGLTPNVPTKSSPLGEIPAHWEVARIKRVLKELESGKREDDGKEEVLSIGGEHIQDGEFYLEHKMFVSEDTYSSTRGKIQRGDILIVKDGATIGKCMYVDDMPEPKMLLNEHVYRLACTSKYSNLYFYYVIASQFSQDWFWSRNMSSAQESIIQNTLLTLPIAIPPLDEQLEIAKYLNEECKKIDKKCKLIDEQIKKLQLLKRALINEVVTGKRQLA